MTCIIFAKSLGTHPLFEKLPQESKEDKSSKYFDRYRVNTIWKYNLPSDRLAVLNEINIELNQGIGSRREAMERLGKTNIPKIWDEITEDDKRKVDIAKEISQAKVPNESTKLPPNA